MRKPANYLAAVFMLAFLFQAGLKAYAGNGKLYLATNKENYSPAEFVQFQLFLLNTSKTDNTVYVELLDCKGNKLAKKMFPLSSNTSWGNIELPKDAKAEFYVLYCYLLNKDTVEIDCNKKILINASNPGRVIKPSKTLLLNSYVEGSTFVAGLSNNLLINCKDENGNPFSTAGAIIDDKDIILTEFNTDSRGFAKLVFNPAFLVQYFIVVLNKDGQEIKKPLQLASEFGINMNVTVTGDSLNYNIYSNATDKDELDYKLSIISNGETIYKADINFQVNISVIKQQINLKNLPLGFLTLRLTDKKDRFYAQRIIYNSYETKNKSLIKIVDTVTKKSVSVTIPGYVNGNGYLNLVVKDTAKINGGSLKDYAEVPVIVNTYGNEISFNDFLISCNEAPEQNNATNTNNNSFLTLTGTIYDSENKPLRNKPVSLIFLYRNLNKEFLTITTDANGSFKINDVLFYDSATVYYQLADNSQQKNNLKLKLEVTPSLTDKAGNAFRVINFTCAANFTKTDIKTDSSLINPFAKTLQEVIVTSKLEKTASEKFKEKYISAQYNSTSLLRGEIDLIKNPEIIDNGNIFDYIQGRIPGLTIKRSFGGGILIKSSNDGTVGVYLNDMELDRENLGTVSFLQVREVALVRYYALGFHPKSFPIGSMGSDGGDIMIYTKRDFNSSNEAEVSLSKTIIRGYNFPKTISQPVSSSNSLQSIYWEPNWTPQKEEVIYMALPAGSSAKNLQLVIEGINTTFTPYSFTKNLVFN